MVIMNISEILLENGFTCNSGYFDPKSNWFGVSLSEPDAIFRKDNKLAVLSLQGALMMFRVNQIMKMGRTLPQGTESLIESKNARWIALKIGPEYVYESFSGEMPSEDIINKFIAE